MLEDGSDYPQAGRLLFTDLSVDPTSGQITLRAEVPNPTGLLLPGMYVRVRLEQAETPTGIVVPQQAVTRGTDGDSVMVVGADGKVAPRPVKVGAAAEGGQLGDPRGPEAGRDGHGRRLPEAARQRAGEAGAVATARLRAGARAARSAGGTSAALRAHRPPPPAEPARWRSSSSTGPSSRG